MDNDFYSVIELENHPTRDVRDEHINGNLSVIWRDWDEKIELEPKMVYVSSVNPREIKGPHIHTKRNSFFICIHGKVVFIIKNPNGEYVELEVDENKPVMIIIPKNIPSAHINISDKVSRVLTLADVSWKPNDNEMENIEFNDFNWKKYFTS